MNSILFKVVKNVLKHAVVVGKSANVVIVTILVDWIDWGPQRNEHYKNSLYDVKISRHLNVH